MSKRPQKIACVVLAVMMVWTVMPGLGVAEDVTTPSDLPQVTEVPTEAPTEVPTEEPTEVPTEVPTEEPVEEVPPVLVEEPVEPPMLMVTAPQVDLTTYGITPGEGATYEVTDDYITLQSGSFSASSINDSGKTIVIESGATLTITKSASFTKITVQGTLTLQGYDITLNGAVTVAGGSLSSTGGPLNTNRIIQLTINSTSGTNLKYTYVNILNLPESWLKDIAQKFAEDELELYSGANPPTQTLPKSTWFTISNTAMGVNLQSINEKKVMNFKFSPKETDQVVDSETVEYEVTFYNGGNNPKFNIMVPVKEKIKVHAEGHIYKVYDGTGDFSGEMRFVSWKDEAGKTYNDLSIIECIASGTWDGGVLKSNTTYHDIPCNVAITSQNLPAGFIFEQKGKVEIRVNIRNMILTPKSLEIYEGETPALEVESNTGVDKGLAPNQTVEVTFVIKDSNGKKMDDAVLPVGVYTIAIEMWSEKIKDASGNEVSSWNYSIDYGTGTLIVKEPTYTVTIPAGVELTGGAGSMAIDCEIHGKISVDVAATSANGWKLEGDSQSLDYTLTPEASATRAATGDALASFTESGTANLVFATDPKPAAGTYTDTLTFTVTANK